MPTRRTLMAGAAATLALAACASLPDATARPPIVFMHGNGDSAALWQTTVWRFESNGWPRDRLFVLEQPYPLSRDDDAVPQAGRSSTDESAAFLAAEVERVRRLTGAAKVILMGNSRGGNTIRNYVQNRGGDRFVSHVVLGGNPAHGIWSVKGFREGNEFSALSPFMQKLNAPKNAAGDEVTPGVRWLTVRSDNNDKYAQPDGLWIGAKDIATNIGYDGPALKGATNIVLPRVDHRETSFSPAAFAAAWQFVTGQAPARTDVLGEGRVVLSGRVGGLGVDPLDPQSGNFANNLPLSGARVSVYGVDPATGERVGAARWQQSVAADGAWGPVEVPAGAPLEFELAAPGYATSHIYRSGFPRSSTIVNLRAERLAAADRQAGAVVLFSRPRGYFDAQRDTMRFDGSAVLPGVPPTGAGVASARLLLKSAELRPVAGEFNGERVVGRSWPVAEGHLSILELTY